MNAVGILGGVQLEVARPGVGVRVPRKGLLNIRPGVAVMGMAEVDSVDVDQQRAPIGGDTLGLRGQSPAEVHETCSRGHPSLGRRVDGAEGRGVGTVSGGDSPRTDQDVVPLLIEGVGVDGEAVVHPLVGKSVGEEHEAPPGPPGEGGVRVGGLHVRSGPFDDGGVTEEDVSALRGGGGAVDLHGGHLHVVQGPTGDGDATGDRGVVCRGVEEPIGDLRRRRGVDCQGDRHSGTAPQTTGGGYRHVPSVGPGSESPGNDSHVEEAGTGSRGGGEGDPALIGGSGPVQRPSPGVENDQRLGGGDGAGDGAEGERALGNPDDRRRIIVEVEGGIAGVGEGIPGSDHLHRIDPRRRLACGKATRSPGVALHRRGESLNDGPHLGTVLVEFKVYGSGEPRRGPRDRLALADLPGLSSVRGGELESRRRGHREDPQLQLARAPPPEDVEGRGGHGQGGFDRLGHPGGRIQGHLAPDPVAQRGEVDGTGGRVVGEGHVDLS